LIIREKGVFSLYPWFFAKEIAAIATMIEVVGVPRAVSALAKAYK
jgi:hypothetical protein